MTLGTGEQAMMSLLSKSCGDKCLQLDSFDQAMERTVKDFLGIDSRCVRVCVWLVLTPPKML